MKLLVTGFEPFDGRGINQSEKMAQVLAGPECLILPVTFQECYQSVEHWLSGFDESDEKPFVLSLGEAPVKNLQLEVIAVNKKHAPSRGDNDNEKPFAESLDPDGELALEGSLNPQVVVEVLGRCDYEINISFSAGQYVCNALYYYLLQQVRRGRCKAAFFHLPVEMTESLFLSVEQRLKHLKQLIEKGEL